MLGFCGFYYGFWYMWLIILGVIERLFEVFFWSDEVFIKFGRFLMINCGIICLDRGFSGIEIFFKENLGG